MQTAWWMRPRNYSPSAPLVRRKLHPPRLCTWHVIEVIAALAVLFAFWRLRQTSNIHTNLFDVLTVVVTTVTVLVVAATLLRSVMVPRPLLERVIRGLEIASLAIVLWFMLVDWCWFEEGCRRCGNRRTVFEYRFCSVAVQRSVKPWNRPTLIEYIARDIGIPCSHDRRERATHQRWIGSCLIVEHGGSYIWDPPWYPRCARDAVRSWVAEDPSFVKTFRERVLDPDAKDWGYWHGLVVRMTYACPANERQAPPSEEEVESDDGARHST
jgi:hypothetical protein